MTIVFFGRRLQGGPVTLLVGFKASPQAHDAVKSKRGLDRCLPEQYDRCLRLIAGGDVGDSIRERRPASEAVLSRLGATAQLASAALLLSDEGVDAIEVTNLFSSSFVAALRGALHLRWGNRRVFNEILGRPRIRDSMNSEMRRPRTVASMRVSRHIRPCSKSGTKKREAQYSTSRSKTMLCAATSSGFLFVFCMDLWPDVLKFAGE